MFANTLTSFIIVNKRTLFVPQSLERGKSLPHRDCEILRGTQAGIATTASKKFYYLLEFIDDIILVGV